MIRLRSSFLLLASLATLGPLGSVRANTVHAWYAPFSVTVEDASTIFNDYALFNGSRTNLYGGFGVRGLGGGPVATTAGGRVVATFEADPGYVFTGVDLHFGQWSWSNSYSFGGYVHTGNWSVSGGTYVGDTNPPDAGTGSTSWSGSGSSGVFAISNFDWWSGGGNQSFGIMGSSPAGAILLSNVTSFTVVMEMDITVYNTSEYGMSSFNITPQFTFAPPATVPDQPLSVALIGAVLLGTAAFGRRHQTRNSP